MKTLRNFTPLLWQVYACSENEVYYLVKTKKGKLTWKDIDSFSSNKDIVVATSLKKLKKVMKLASQPPINCDDFEFVKGYPTTEEGIGNRMFWLTTETYFRKTIKR